MIRFRMEWQEAPGVRDTILARTWCRLVIEAGGRLVTESIHGPSESLRGGVYGSVFPLCQWIVENWWFLLNESYRFPARHTSSDLARSPRDRAWVQRHSLLAAAEGNALPDLTLHRDEQQVVVRWMPDGDASTHPALRFTGAGEVHMNAQDVEQGLAEAVQAVLDRLDGMAAPEVSELREDWAAVAEATEQERQLCEWSARLGVDPFDPDELTEELQEALLESVADIDVPLRDDFLDATSPQTLGSDVDWLHRAEEVAADAGAGQGVEAVSCDVSAEAAHQHGYACAKALRRHLSPANGHDPIADLDELLLRLGWAQRPSRTLDLHADSSLAASLTLSEVGAPVAVIGDAGPTGNRFRLARSAFFHHFTDNGRRRLITEGHTWQQRASRAFAAELLAPAAGIAKHLGGKASPSRIEELANRYRVSSHTISHQIGNHRLAWINAS